ncbi:tyrosine-protein phosphatase [Conexibacter arvalis]|uniref:protein-tyrosine-phosphatase n=1 Tax=Conexibacter arvalis TaxID=912552 RepID=A0A840ICH8_9ACTN|nr:CpsB/CapC family capsule biosynthesis tyrosine phosphatase [Conexibacter arvalis]MBB4661650.1 protein-tyrosine phosphatase [Conexibacter arvalis]
MIDLHCHILAGLDDGPADLEASVALARRQVAAGVDTVVATPHVSAAYPDVDAAAADAAAERLRERLAAERIELRLLTAGELAADRAVRLEDGELERLRLGDGPWLLVEAPLGVREVGFDVLMRQLRARGHEILIAHPERSPDFRRRPEVLRGLVADGMRVQATAGAFDGRFGGLVQRTARGLLEAGLVHVVASDAHDDRVRAPGLASALEAVGADPDQVRSLTETAPAAILAGTELPAAPRLAARRLRRPGWLRRG